MDTEKLNKFLEEKKDSKEEFNIFQAKIGKDGKLTVIDFPVSWIAPKEKKSSLFGQEFSTKGKFMVPKKYVDETNFKGNRNYAEDEIGAIKSPRSMSAVSITPLHALEILENHFKERIEDFDKRAADIASLKESTSEYLAQISEKLKTTEASEFD